MRQPRETRTTQISFHLLNKPRHTAPLSHGSRVAPTRHILRTRSTPDADPHQTDAHTLCTIRADADSGCRQRRPQQLRIAVAWRVAQARHTCHTGPTSGDANWSSRRDACTRHIVAACAARSCLRPSACGGRRRIRRRLRRSLIQRSAGPASRRRKSRPCWSLGAARGLAARESSHATMRSCESVCVSQCFSCL